MRKLRARVMSSAMARRIIGASDMHGCVGGILRVTGRGGNQILQVKSSKSVEVIRGYITDHKHKPRHNIVVHRHF
jgi:hypothetical protein